MSARAYPCHPDELTAEWLTTQLRRFGALNGATVTSFNTTPVGVGVGMMGILVRIVPSYDRPDGAPPSLIAKFTTAVEANRAVGMHFQIYEREVRFFRCVAPTVDAVTPRCFAAEIDPATGDSVLLLEDLADYRVGDQVRGCSAAEAVEIIDAIVPLHAAFWGRTSDPELGWVPRIDGEIQMGGFVGGCQVGWDPFVNLFGHVIADEIKVAKDRFVPAVAELHRMMGRRVQTFVHGDVRLDNVMFGVIPGHHPVVMLDWQGSLVSSGLQDVAYLLTQNVTTEERRAHEAELVEHYHRRLVELGGDRLQPGAMLGRLQVRGAVRVLLRGGDRWHVGPVERARCPVHGGAGPPLVRRGHRPRCALAPARARLSVGRYVGDRYRHRTPRRDRS